MHPQCLLAEEWVVECPECINSGIQQIFATLGIRFPGFFFEIKHQRDSFDFGKFD